MSKNPFNPGVEVETDEIIGAGVSPAQATGEISWTVVDRPNSVGFLGPWGLAFLGLTLLLIAICYLFYEGVGIWGIQIPVAWGFAITSFVWWIGIGHAGTLISAILYLMHQEWRTSINRFAEAMTLFAVMCAGMFPLLHLGRPWFFYWIIPYPNAMDLWPQFRSPLVWDFFAVSTYFTISLIFWYVGLIPDLAILRDRAKKNWVKRAYGILSLGWRGTAPQWRRYKKSYLILAGIATPLVVSVHSVVSLDFSYANLPGWHSTIFPPYFVAGAIFSGFAMVLTLSIPLRKFFGLKNLITIKHLENCAKLLLATGLVVAYGYACEVFMAYYSGDTYERFIAADRFFGYYAAHYWILITCNVLVPQLIWFKKVRTSPAWLFVISILVNIGMWVERYVIVVQSLHADFLPAMWKTYRGSVWDYMTLIGSFGLFFFCFYLFLRTLPSISISEMSELAHKTRMKESSP